MSKIPWFQLVEDKKQNRYVGNLFLYTLFVGTSGICCLFGMPGFFLLLSEYQDQPLSLSLQSMIFLIAVGSYCTYPLAVMFSLGAGWYRVIKKRYAYIYVILLIPFCNLLVYALVAFANRSGSTG
jgi:hypothetical protein